MYYIRVDTDEELALLRKLVTSLHTKYHNAWSSYVEHIENIDALKRAVDHPLLTVEEAGEVAEKPTPHPMRTRKEQEVLPSLCPEHPKYAARRHPRTDCQGCWDAYERLNPTRIAAAKRNFARRR